MPGLCQERAISFADANPFERHERVVEDRAQHGRTPSNGRTVPDGNNHERYIGVPAEELGAFPFTVCRPVDTQEHGCTCHTLLVKEINHTHEGRSIPHTLLATTVH